MDRFFNALKSQAAALDRSRGQPRFATVASVDPARYAARVTLQPEDVLTGWLPILSPWVGAGWGLVCPPSPGDQVLVLPQEGDGEHGVVVRRCVLRSRAVAGGALGRAVARAPLRQFPEAADDGTVQVNGDLHVAGDVYDRHGRSTACAGNYNMHMHPDPQGGNTGTTSNPDPEYGDARPLPPVRLRLRAGAAGDLAPAAGTLRGQQRVLRRLLTNPGDYIWQPGYGAGLGQFVGKPASAGAYPRRHPQPDFSGEPRSRARRSR